MTIRGRKYGNSWRVNIFHEKVTLVIYIVYDLIDIWEVLVDIPSFDYQKRFFSREIMWLMGYSVSIPTPFSPIAFLAEHNDTARSLVERE